MKSIIARIVFLGVTTGVVTLVVLKGGKNMPAQQKDTAVSIVLPSADAQPVGLLETATFALG